MGFVCLLGSGHTHKTLGPKTPPKTCQPLVRLTRFKQVYINFHTHFDKAVSQFDQPSQFDGGEIDYPYDMDSSV